MYHTSFSLCCHLYPLTFPGSFFDLFEKYGGYKSGQIKLKRPQQLQEMLDIARSLLRAMEGKDKEKRSADIEEKKSKLLQLRAVLEMLV